MVELLNENIHTNASLNAVMDLIIPFLNDREKPMTEIRVKPNPSLPNTLKEAFFSIGYSIAVQRVPQKQRAYEIYTVSLCDVFNRDETGRCDSCGNYNVISSLITNRKNYCTKCGETCHRFYDHR